MIFNKEVLWHEINKIKILDYSNPICDTEYVIKFLFPLKQM